LSENEKEVIRRSWATLTAKKFVDESGISKSGIGKLFEDFYTRFFSEDPTGKRLFENSGLKAQGRALVSMIGMIVVSLDNFQSFADKILQLGGRHNIYGVKPRDYEIFEKILSETIGNLIQGSEGLIVTEVCEAWHKVIHTLGNIMAQASLAAVKAATAVVHRRIMTNGSWKKTAVSLGLNDIHIYRSEEATKLRSSLPLKSVTDLEVIEDDEGMPHKYGVKAVYGAGDTEKACFSFTTREDAQRWMEELDWRVQAHHRVYKFDDDVSSSEESGTASSNTGRRRGGGGGGGGGSGDKKGKNSKSKFSLGQKGRKK